MTSPSDAKCCCCINLRIGVLTYLGLAILGSGVLVGMSSSKSGSSFSDVIVVIVQIAFAALTLFFAAKRMHTGYKVCVYILMILFILLVVYVVLFLAAGSVALASGAAKTTFSNAGVDQGSVNTVFAIVASIFVVLLLVQAYFLSVLWRYIGVMQQEIAERKQKQVSA